MYSRNGAVKKWDKFGMKEKYLQKILTGDFVQTRAFVDLKIILCITLDREDN